MEYKIREKLFGANKSSAIGTSLTLNDTVKYPINKLTIDGVCKQETTTGKQLLDYDNLTNIGHLTKINPYGFRITGTKAWTSENFTIDLKANTKYTFKCLFNQIDEMSTIEVSIREENGKIIKDLISSKKNGTLIGSFTTEAITKTTFHLYSNLSATPKTTTCDFTYLQIVEGELTNETMPDFEHYTGGQPSPSPDYPQNISVLTGNLKVTSCGKNLFKMGTVNDYDYKNRITNIIDDKISIKLFKEGLTFTYNKLNKFKGNKKYYITALSEVSNARFYIRLRNSDDTGWLNSNDVNLAGMEYISSYNGWYYNCSSMDMKKIISIPDCLYWELGFGFHSSAGTIGESYTISNIMVSDFDTPYEPYQGSSLNITIPSNEFAAKLDDTYKDTLNVVYKPDGHYHLILNKMIGKVVLDGSEEGWLYDSNNKYFRTNTYVFERIPLSLSSENKAMYSQISNSFIINKNWSGTNSFRDNINVQGEFYPVQNKGYKLAFRNLNFDNVDDFKSYLSSKNIIVVYPLETPYEVDLGIVDTLLSYDEITNIFTDSDLYPVINVKYYNGSLDISNYEFSIKEV